MSPVDEVLVCLCHDRHLSCIPNLVLSLVVDTFLSLQKPANQASSSPAPSLPSLPHLLPCNTSAFSTNQPVTPTLSSVVASPKTPACSPTSDAHPFSLA